MKTIQILAKEWFDKVNGNSYFSACVYFDNYLVCTLPFQYGYGDHYVDMAKKELEKLGHITVEHYGNGGSSSLWRWCEENGVKLLTSKSENCLKRDVIAFGIK